MVSFDLPWAPRSGVDSKVESTCRLRQRQRVVVGPMVFTSDFDSGHRFRQNPCYIVFCPQSYIEKGDADA